MEHRMDQALDLDGLTKAARRREFEDGLMDFLVGGIILALSLLNGFLFSPSGLAWYALAVVRHRELAILGLIGLAALAILGPLGARKAIERIRLSSLWRDRGFVRPLRRQPSRSALLLSAVAVVGLILGALWLRAGGRTDTEGVLRALAAAPGIATGIIYLGIGRSLGLRRYLAAGLAGGVLSAAILLWPISFSLAWLALGMIWAAVLGVSGAWAFRQAWQEPTAASRG